MKNKEALERFEALAENNPGKYVIVTEKEGGFVLDSDEESAKVPREKGLKAFYFTPTLPTNGKGHSLKTYRSRVVLQKRGIFRFWVDR